MRLPRLGELFACRLCWRITLAVFALILAVESVILVPSAQRFERDELERLAVRAEVSVESALALGQRLAGAGAFDRELVALVGQYGIDAIATYRPDGRLFNAVGATPAPALPSHDELLGRMARMVSRSADGANLGVAWQSAAPGTPLVAVRVDSSHVRGALAAYLLRIAGLVAIIVLVVTAGTMLVLHRSVLRPMLRLRQSSIEAGSDPDRAEDFIVRTRRGDEMGELIGAHNALLGRVAESKRRDRELAEERARFLSRHQPLTGLPNREALVEHVDRLGAQPAGPGRCVSLLLVNLAQFRLLNASFGPQRCDELLKQFAVRLRSTAPVRDFVAHLGADRFALVHDAAECSAAGVSGLAETLLREAGQGYDLGGTSVVSLAMRIGISRSEGRAPEGLTLLHEAELALARAAETEGARYSFYSPEHAEQARARQSLARDLERALERGELFPVLQPKMALEPNAGQRLSGAEALLRWKHPERGFVRPDHFIPLAESNGLIVPIGDFMLRAACGTMRDWKERHGWAPRIAVNLSAQQFADELLPERIASALAAERVEAKQLELEITETAAMKDVAKTARTLGALRSLGVHVSIDDFGTGYSSLNYLRRFAVDAIKIDKSFVDDIGQDANADAVCDAILRLGQSLGTRVIAEGVETERQLAFLRQRRCDEVQGYLFGKPVPVEEFEKTWIAARAAA